jgi:hypothetical protein
VAPRFNNAVDDLSAPHTDTPLPLAPRAQRLRNAQTTRAERLRKRKFRRNLFTFIVAQLVIAGVAFVGVRDYMSDV